MQSASERQQDILNLLASNGEVSIGMLAARHAVSEMTVRRDLTVLADEGLVVRTHGGATPAANSFEPPFSLRTRTNAEAKAAIALAVAAQVKDGQSIVLDGGSTGLAVAQALVGRNITVCALNLRVADVLNADAATRVLIPGGQLRTGEASIVGPETEPFLRSLRFDSYVLTASAASVEAGLMEWNREDAAIKRAAMASSRQTIAAVDASKFGKEAFARICSVQDVDLIVTDSSASAELKQRVQAAGASLRIA